MSTDIWKRRPQYMAVRSTSSDDIRATWAGPISTKLYGDKLQRLSNITRNNLMRIKSTMMRHDPCLEYGIEHWHTDQNPHSAQAYRVQGPDRWTTAWQDPGVMFTSSSSLQSLGLQSASTLVANSDAVSVAPSTAPTNFCYLCSTMEEHKKHQLRLRSARRVIKPGKPRVSYIAPRPRVKKKAPEPKEVPEILYRIEVFTGSVTEAGTSASVYITLHGKNDSSLRTHLKNGRGSSRFCFMKGSKETFYYKGPRLGDLSYITVEHEPQALQKKTPGMSNPEERDSAKLQRSRREHWYLDYIVVTNMQTDQSWEFVCKDWLYRVERDIAASARQRTIRELEVTVLTGKKRLAGTDAKVYLTMFGKSGATNKIHLPDDKNHKKFERGQEDRFIIRTKDIGDIRRIRIEHDGSGFASGWNLDQVTIQDVNDPKFRYTFYYGGWIGTDVGDGRLWRELRARTKTDKEVQHGRKVPEKGREIRYRVSVHTGDVKYAGTDANVYIQFVGPKGTTRKIQMDDARDNFERGMTEHFELRGIDVGPLTRIIVSHDNTGAGAGWFLEDVRVRRYLSKAEQAERLKRMRKFHKQGSVNRKKRMAERLNKEDELNEGKDVSESSDSSESDSDADDNKSRKSSRSRNSNREKEFASDVFDRDGKVLKIPEYEEYFFEGKCWLAKDEETGQTAKELPVTRKETMFKERN